MTMQRTVKTCVSALRQVAYMALATVPLLGTVQAATDEVVYFHTDALGSPTAAFNEAGETYWAETYAPYGEKLDNEDKLEPADGCGLLKTDVGYTGHVQDGSGLVYAQQRYYDPVIGRFMSTDPTKPTAEDPRYFGRYQYGGNNPYKYVDPNGDDFENSQLVQRTYNSYMNNLRSSYLRAAIQVTPEVLTDAERRRGLEDAALATVATGAACVTAGCGGPAGLLIGGVEVSRGLSVAFGPDKKDPLITAIEGLGASEEKAETIAQGIGVLSGVRGLSKSLKSRIQKGLDPVGASESASSAGDALQSVSDLHTADRTIRTLSDLDAK